MVKVRLRAERKIGEITKAMERAQTPGHNQYTKELMSDAPARANAPPSRVGIT